MIKFWITTRPAPGMTRERFDYEWGVIHTSLMVTTPSVLNGSFVRYVQHRALGAGAGLATALFPAPAEGWYSIADHSCRSYDDVLASVGAPDYRRRIFPHRFSDAAMVVELTGCEVLHDATPARPAAGGVKLVNHVRRLPGVRQRDFAGWWRDEYAPLLVELGTRSAALRRYVQNPALDLDPGFFAGTLFELGHTGTYAGIDELWFADAPAYTRFAADDDGRERLGRAARGWLDPHRSFGMVVVERVVFDFLAALPDGAPAVRDPASVEFAMLASERADGDWTTPQPAT